MTRDRLFSDAIIGLRLPRGAVACYISRMLDHQTCEDARQRRDPAYDGVFVIAVRTTGIYCRPVCRVRMPRPENVEFYPSAPAAERAGFRPCLRCRPETAPFCPAWNGSRTTVDRALKMISDGALDGGSVEGLADRLGVGARHLGRLFAQHMDASPSQVAKTIRIQRAKRLLNDTDLSIAEIAEQAGFASARRMTAAFSDLYGRPPSELRRHPKRAETTYAHAPRNARPEGDRPWPM